MSKKLIKILLFLLISLFLIISLLEFFSKRCKTQNQSYASVCTEVLKKHDLYGSYNGVKDDVPINDVLSNHVFYVDRNEIGSTNGIACWFHGYAFVANDMPKAATSYVALHEALHLKYFTYSETKVNYMAGKEVPFGLLQTVFDSLARGTSSIEKKGIPCYLGGVWRNFKLYFLNME